MGYVQADVDRVVDQLVEQRHRARQQAHMAASFVGTVDRRDRYRVAVMLGDRFRRALVEREGALGPGKEWACRVPAGVPEVMRWASTFLFDFANGKDHLVDLAWLDVDSEKVEGTFDALMCLLAYTADRVAGPKEDAR